jgi:hypothetical protein
MRTLTIIQYEFKTIFNTINFHTYKVFPCNSTIKINLNTKKNLNHDKIIKNKIYLEIKKFVRKKNKNLIHNF